MNQSNRDGITRKVRTVSITLFALHMMSIAVLSQQQIPRVAPASIPAGMAAIKLADGRDVQSAPVPDLPYNGDQQCGPWQRVNTLGYYNPCNVVAQAGVPFRGWIVGQNLCGGDNIAAIVAIDHAPFQTIGPAPNPPYPIPSTTEDFDIYYYPTGSWPERLHLNGDHLWQNPGTYSISGRAQTICIRPYNRQWPYLFPITVQANVYEPTAPQSITTPRGGKAIAGGTYPGFGRVTQFSDIPVPASGSLVLLTVDKLGILDLVHHLGELACNKQQVSITFRPTFMFQRGSRLQISTWLLQRARRPVTRSRFVLNVLEYREIGK